MSNELLARARDSASFLSNLLWPILRHQRENGVVGSCLENCADTIESLRSRLNHTGLSLLGDTNPSQLYQWVVAASDLLDDLGELLGDWQRRGDLALYLEVGSTSRRVFDERLFRLDNHVAALDSALKAPDEERMTALATLSDVSRLLPLESPGLEFWVTNFGSNTYQVDFKQFQRGLSNSFPNLSERSWIQLKASIDSDDTGMVSVYKWGAFLEGFGPEIATAINQMGETLGEDYFAGFLSYDEATEVLRMCTPGAFLVRFSTSQPCALVLARRKETAPARSSESSQVLQTVIIARRGAFEMDGKLYSSLHELISSQSDCRFAAPVVKSVARARFFKGFLTKEATIKLLQHEPSGTFLFRFSNAEPGTLVVGYKVGDDVLQTRVFCEPESGGYRLAGTQEIYPQIDDIVRLNSSRLRFPYGSKSHVELLPASPMLSQDSQIYDRYGGLQTFPTMKEESNYGSVDGLI